MAKHKLIQINEVGLRDGLQNQSEILSTNDKFSLYKSLVRQGFLDLEVGAFVRDDRVPQMADTAELLALTQSLFKKTPIPPKLKRHVLIPNLRGLETALLNNNFEVVSVFTAASETFVRKNIGLSIRESLEEFRHIVKRAKSKKLKIRGYVSTAYVCPFEGPISPRKTKSVVSALIEMGCYQVSVGDTIGAASPKQVRDLWKTLLGSFPGSKFSGHFHDTYGTALANVLESLNHGITSFDSSLGGLGGCPFAPGASGNLATEDLVYLLEKMGFHSGISFARLCEASLQFFDSITIPTRSRALDAFRAKSGKSCST